MESPSEPSTPKRRYDASRRQADALGRRRRVVEAATELFLEHGYGGTSIDAVAKAAGVSAQSVYASFESKAGILAQAVHLARTGDEEGSLQRTEQALAILREPDIKRRCRLIAELLRGAYERAARLIAMVERASATDPALAAFHDEMRSSRHLSVRSLSASMPKRVFRKEVGDAEAAFDVLAVIASPHVYTELVDHCGWTPARYETWLADALYQTVFAR
jgi:AcrR family transcriptional regulator